MAFDGAHRDLQPPRNEEVEQALLAAILVQNAAYEAVADFLRPEHFYLAVHGRIYAAEASARVELDMPAAKIREQVEQGLYQIAESETGRGGVIGAGDSAAA